MEKTTYSTEVDLDRDPAPKPGDHGREASQESQSPQVAKESIWEKLWIFELVAWLFCALGLLAIVVILRTTEGEPMPTWTTDDRRTGVRFTVTINSVISIFSTLVKSTLLIPVVASLHQLKWLWFKEERPLADVAVFEASSRGPLGSLVLIWSLRGRALACLGAFIIIASLGIDFSLQQLVTYPLRPAPRGVGAVARTNVYSASRIDTASSGRAIELPMVAAIYRGIYNFNSSPFLPEAECESDNCTWSKPYTSIGICSQCRDVTTLLNTTCTPRPYVVYVYDPPDSNNVVGNRTVGDPILQCTHSLHGKEILLERMEDEPIIMQINSTSTYASDHFNNALLAARISYFTVFRGTPEVFSDWVGADFRQWWNYSNVNAAECGFDICVHKYEGSMTKAVFGEHHVDSFINETEFGSRDQDGNLKEVVIRPPSSWTNQSDVDDANVFKVDTATYSALRSFFNQGQDYDIWKGYVFKVGVIGDPVESSEMATLINPMGFGELETLAADVAASMTKRMREAPTNETLGFGQNSKGTAYLDVPYVNVRWAWIALPASLVALSFVFLIVTIIQNQRAGAMLWKANSLASFYNPLTKDGRDELQVGHTSEEAERIAQGMKVRWMSTNAGVRLAQTHEN